MRVELLRKLTDVSSYIFEEMTDRMSEIDMAREFWKYLRSRFLDDMNQKVRVSDFVNEFIKKIIVHEADKSSGHRRQTVEIVFNFVGQIEIPILTEPITLEASPKQRKTA